MIQLCVEICTFDSTFLRFSTNIKFQNRTIVREKINCSICAYYYNGCTASRIYFTGILNNKYHVSGELVLSHCPRCRSIAIICNNNIIVDNITYVMVKYEPQ